ncbi:MAG TPA: type II toxin-antitoxin system death-on-curing family toxin [Candidatus Hydrogenedentes bacterium]|nr:MAG: Toxin Doc [Candidatus Hydrogenedentes bacterium ADurb.Bin179]HOH30180.1 type II toxin-antitoxin system death-on-curing family toxin [Candidatus Hydrogenedentota bacterium]
MRFRYLTLGEVLDLYQKIIRQSGGAMGLRDLGLLESALAQPRASFSGKDLYETVEDKAAALGFSLIANHPFIDGNKRVGHAAMELFLMLNGSEINATIEEQEALILRLASGKLNRAQLCAWLKTHIQKTPPGME